jgi:hypothetical protein
MNFCVFLVFCCFVFVFPPKMFLGTGPLKKVLTGLSQLLPGVTNENHIIPQSG